MEYRGIDTQGSHLFQCQNCNEWISYPAHWRGKESKGSMESIVAEEHSRVCEESELTDEMVERLRQQQDKVRQGERGEKLK